MDSIQYLPAEGGFTLLVRPPGWFSQKLWIIVTAVTFAIATACTNAAIHGNRPNLIFAAIFWFTGLSALAAAFQGARRRVVFIANAQSFIIATEGPLRKTLREFPRDSLQAALVADSTTIVNGQPLQQLQLHFANRNTPLHMFTGRDPADLTRIAQYLTEALQLAGNSFSPTQYMEIRHAPLHVKTLKIVCYTGFGICLALLCFPSAISRQAAILAFFVSIIADIFVLSIITGKARCPNCNAMMKRDNLSSEGYFQYTCSACRIIWQSPIRAGGANT